MIDFEYNLLNLPKQIIHTNGNMETYKYETDGTKLSVTYKINPETVTAPMTSVMRTAATQEDGYEIHTTTHCGDVVYNDAECKILIDNGYIKFDSQNNPQYYYYVKDHLGNNHLVLDASQNIVQSNCYDPFGTWYDDGTNTGSVQPYKYNGKELDRTNGLDLYDYGARNYDAAVFGWTAGEIYDDWSKNKEGE